MILQAAALSLLFCSVSGFTIQGPSEKSDESSGNIMDDDEFSVSTLIEKANANLGKNVGDPQVMFGDILVPTGLQNAAPCTGQPQGCLWPKSRDGNVYVPYLISKEYSQSEREVIIKGLRSFAETTCIRFTPRKRQEHFLDIKSDSGCFSSVGRQDQAQELSLERPSLDRLGCVYHHTVQHELLHALGFHHEQSRSDRDQHVRILLENVIPGKRRNFRRIPDTRNLGTPYDYGSVMHYHRTAFTKNGEPTIIPIPNRNVAIGKAKKMSATDIRRVNLLYRCKKYLADLEPVQRNHPL